MLNKYILFLFKKKYFIALVVIIFIGSFPRAIEIINGNYLFGFDQGLYYQSVKDIIINHKFTLIGMEVGGKGGFFQGPGWYYLLTIPFILFDGDPYGGLILMFLVGLCVIFFSSVLFSRILGKRTSLIIAFLIAISPGIIPQSRFVWPPFPVSLIAVFYLYFLYQVFDHKRIYLPVLTFTIAVLYHFEIATAGTLLASFILFFPFLIMKNLVSIKHILLSIFSFSIPFIPLFLFDIRHNLLNLRGILHMFSSEKQNGILFTGISNKIQANFAVFISNLSSTFQFGQLFAIIILIFLILGSIMYIRDGRNRSSMKYFVFYLLISPFVLYFVFLFYPSGMWSWWILELPIFYCFIVGILIIYFIQYRLLKPILLMIIILFFIGYVNHVVSLYRNDLYDYGGTAKIKGKIDAIDYIYRDSGGKKFNLLVFTPPVYTYEYDYLLWWYGERKYHYVPGNTKEGMYYLLIAPDPEKPWSYKGWLETIIKTGKIVNEKKLSSGFIIQKRIDEN